MADRGRNWPRIGRSVHHLFAQNPISGQVAGRCLGEEGEFYVLLSLGQLHSAKHIVELGSVFAEEVGEVIFISHHKDVFRRRSF